MKIDRKAYLFLAVSILLVTGLLAIATAFQAREAELRELERECDLQLQRVIEIRDRLGEATERMADLEEMLLNLRRMERIVSRSAAPSRGGGGGRRQITLTNMPLDTPSGYSAARFERAFAGTALEGIGEALVLAEMETGINALVLAGIIVHETGWGNSALARDKHNMAGLGAYDGAEYSAGIAFDSRAECVMFLAELLRDKPGTLADVGQWYASDPAWSRKVAGCMKTIAGRGGR